MLSNGFQDIADDPPDYNYTELAALDFEKLTELDNTILSAEETELMLNYMNYSLEAGRWLEVALRSLERYQGAAYSNDLFWAEAQLEHYLYAMEMYNQAISMGNVYQQELAALLDTYEAMDVAELDEQSINDALEEILTGIDSGLYDDYFNNTAQMLNINIADLIGSVTNSAYEMSEFLITGVPLTLDVGDAQFTSNGADLLSVAQTVDSSGEAWLYLSIFYLIYRRSSRAD